MTMIVIEKGRKEEGRALSLPPSLGAQSGFSISGEVTISPLI